MQHTPEPHPSLARHCRHFSRGGQPAKGRADHSLLGDRNAAVLKRNKCFAAALAAAALAAAAEPAAAEPAAACSWSRRGSHRQRVSCLYIFGTALWNHLVAIYMNRLRLEQGPHNLVQSACVCVCDCVRFFLGPAGSSVERVIKKESRVYKEEQERVRENGKKVVNSMCA